MEQLSRKICLFLFLTAVLSGRANDLGTLVGAITGTILLWPLYELFVSGRPSAKSQKFVAGDERDQTASR